MKRKHYFVILLVLVISACSGKENTPGVTLMPIPEDTQKVDAPLPTDTQELTSAPVVIEETQEVIVTGWTQHLISKNFNYTQSVDAEDIDKDGDIDFVATSKKDKITWWRNNGGDPVDWEKFPVTTDFPWAHSVMLIDIDQDGWLDVLGAGYSANEIAWWKNSGGEEITWIKQSIDPTFYRALEVDAADLDADGDIDVIGTSGGEASWWRNDGGDPIQWTKFKLKKSVAFWPVKSGDLDNDGDIDIVGGADGPGDIYWWENAPDKTDPDAGLFVEHLITDDFPRVSGLHLNDVDGDGDIDILGSALNADIVAMWRNDGGSPVVWTKQIIDDQFGGALYVFSGDVDGDSDIDVISTAGAAWEVAWWRNDGGDPISWDKEVLGTQLKEPHGISMSDFDGDGDMDIIITVAGLNDIIWFENELND